MTASAEPTPRSTKLHDNDFPEPERGPRQWQLSEEVAKAAKELVSEDKFESLLLELRDLHSRKSHDYADGKDPYSNFYRSSDQVRQPPGVSVELHIATKQARLRELLFGDKPSKNEPIRDTLIDRAVYSMIAVILFDRGAYEGGSGNLAS